jgi:hypothetical protein
MPTPTIPNGSAQMAATLYSGNNSTQSINNAVNSVSFQPDMVWIKSRNIGGANHVLTDSVRGVNRFVLPNTTEAELNIANTLTAFNSNGFSLGNTAYDFNISGNNYVAWQWKAGGAAVTNTAGSISAQVSANTTSGFSVVTYSGTGSNATVGHGLGVAPQMIIVKRRNSGVGDTNWFVYHSQLNNGTNPAQYNIKLNLTSGTAGLSNVWNDTAPTSTVFSVGTNVETNGSGGTFVAYCWAPVAGYSAFGSYTGNGSTDGPFVYTGFRPRFILVKSTSASNWFLWDTARNTFNATTTPLFPNNSSAEEGTLYPIDVLSNGFKLRSASGLGPNESSLNYIYMAFAENPFKYALAR